MSDEDPIRNSCLEPQSLVMTRSECFYCFASEGTKCFTIWDNFGIKTCNVHYPLSVRDCKAYMHRENIVSVRDIKDCVELEHLHDIILAEFPIKRSSGLIDDGWSLNLEDYGEIMSYHDSNNWIIPIKRAISGHIRRIYICDLMIPEILKKVPPNFETKFHQFVEIINRGIYKSDNDRYLALVDNNIPINTYAEDRLVGIGICINSNGNVGRILNLPR